MYNSNIAWHEVIFKLAVSWSVYDGTSFRRRILCGRSGAALYIDLNICEI